MTQPRTDDQQLVLDELSQALVRLQNESDATADPDDVVDLLAFSGQAERLHRHRPWPELKQALVAADTWCATHGPLVATTFDGLLPTEAHGPLEAALADESPLAAPLLDALFDLDRLLSALEHAGRDTEALLEDADLLVRCHRTAAALCSAQAQRFIARHGVTGGAAPIWAAVAESASALRAAEHAAAALNPAVPTWLAAELSQRAESNVIRFPIPRRTAAGAPEVARLSAAAAHDHVPIPDAVTAWVAEDGAWELLFESSPDGALVLAMYARDQLPEWHLETPEGPQAPTAAGALRNEIVLRGVAGELTLEVNGARRTLRDDDTR